jgi:predicted Zn-dependent protease
MEFDADSRRLLAELGMLACVTNQVAAAERIAAGLEAAAPGSREAAVCAGLAAMTAGRPGDAVDRLRPLAASGDAYGQVFLGLALKLDGRSAEAERTLAAIAPGEAEADALAAALR